MKRKIFFYLNACFLASVFLISCQNSQYVVSKSNNRKPKFIEGISLGAHNKTDVMPDGIDNSYGYRTSHNYKLGNVEKGREGKDNSVHNPHIDPSVTNTVSEKYAGLLGVLSGQITNFNLYKFIDEWYGVNYRIGGNSKAGIDCSAFVQRLYSEVFGIDIFRTAFEQFTNCIRLHNINEAVEGDLVFFHIHGKRISHVGIYLINDFFVHASRSQGIVISNLNDDYWHKYYACVGRLPRG